MLPSGSLTQVSSWLLALGLTFDPVNDQGSEVAGTPKGFDTLKGFSRGSWEGSYKNV